MYLRSRKKTAREVSFYEPIGTDREGNEIHLLDIIEGDFEDTVERCAFEQNVQLLYRLMESELTPQEYEILKLRYGFFGARMHAEGHRREAGHQPLLRLPH